MPPELHPLERARRAARKRGDLRSLITTDFHAAGLRLPEEHYAAVWRSWRRHPAYRGSGRGAPDAREALARALCHDGAECRAEDLLLTAGSSISYHVTLAVLASRMRGRTRVLLPRPGYPLFEGILAPLGLDPVWYTCRPDRAFLPDPAEIRELLAGAATAGGERPIDGAPLALVLITPNNPTGVSYPPELVAELTSAAEAVGTTVIIDAVFSLFRDPGEAQLHVWSGRGPQRPLVELNGASKLCAAPELKLGWIRLLGGSDTERDTLAEELDTCHDTYLSLSGLAQAAVEPLVTAGPAREARAALRDEVNRRRASLLEQIDGIDGLDAGPARAGIHVPVQLDPFVAARRLGTVDDESIAVRLLDETGLYLHPGSFYGMDQPHVSGSPWLVLSCLSPPDQQRDMLQDLAAWLS